MDLGTGSGALAIGLTRLLPETEVRHKCQKATGWGSNFAVHATCQGFLQRARPSSVVIAETPSPALRKVDDAIGYL
jgi:hypothetical protein